MTTITKPASDKQIALIAKLLGEKNLTSLDDDLKVDAFFLCEGGVLEMRFASRIIDALFKLPKAATPPVTGVALTEGIYLAPNGDVIQLKASKTSGHLYAKVAMAGPERLNLHGDVVKFKFVYAPGLVQHITPAMKMSKEQAEEFSFKFKQCMACGRSLKAAKSVQAGIGPVCAKMFG